MLIAMCIKERNLAENSQLVLSEKLLLISISIYLTNDKNSYSFCSFEVYWYLYLLWDWACPLSIINFILTIKVSFCSEYHDINFILIMKLRLAGAFCCNWCSVEQELVFNSYYSYKRYSFACHCSVVHFCMWLILQIDCHPSLVWTEIMSFIKGSYESLYTEKGYLDKEEYIKLGRKRAPSFSGNRSQIYDIFLKYHNYKQQHSLFDEADLVYKLYCRLRMASSFF